MITKFKLYEELNAGEPEVGDYINITLKDFATFLDKTNIRYLPFTKEQQNYINSSVGKIIRIEEKNNRPLHHRSSNITDLPVHTEQTKYKYYYVLYGNDIYKFYSLEIIINFYSKEEQDVEDFVISKKYNL